jgi:quercetin dioxygenase-like cupin family protein
MPAAVEGAGAGAGSAISMRRTAKSEGRTALRIHNLYADGNGQSHWRDVEVEWVEETRSGKLSKRLPATGIIFREVPPTYDLDWHPAPRRQYIINLDAGVEITASDGEARKLGAGEVILVEDTTGKGHLSKALDGKIRHCIFVPVE